MRSSGWLFLSALIVVVTNEARADPALVERAKHDVLKKLNDPDSARFSEVITKEKGGLQLVCGKVNAKNRLGGYDGFKPFIYSPTVGTGALIYGGTAITDDPLSQIAQMRGYESQCGSSGPN